MTTYDSRQDFVESWLIEHPQRVQPGNDFYKYIVKSIRERQQYSDTLSVGDIRYILGSQTSYFWIEDKEIVIAMETSKQAQAQTITGVAKHPDYSGKPPYAQELYQAALDLQPLALRLQSDNRLSEGGLNVWKRFVADGNAVIVYDQEHPGSSFKLINDPDELDAYMGDTVDSRKYRFALMRGKEMIGETQSFFGTRRMRELSGML